MENLQLPSGKIRLVLTNQCNLKCKFCHEEGVSVSSTSAFPLKRMRSLIKAAKRHGVNKVNITGGEPLLLGSLLNEYIAIIKEENIKKIGLVTNGTHITKSSVDFSKFYKVRISLHSLNSTVYKKITNTDLLEDAITGISYLSDYDIKLALNIVLLRKLNDTKKDLIDIITFAEQRGIGELQFMEVLPTTSFAKKHYVPAQSLESVFDSISNYKEKIDWGAKVYLSERGVKIILMDCPCSGKHCDYCKSGKLSMYLTSTELKRGMLSVGIPISSPENDRTLFKKAMNEFYPFLCS